MNISFDLTTPEGREKALELFDKWGWAIHLPAWLMKKAFDFISSKTSNDIIEAQRKTAIDIIRAGSKQNVNKMTITVDQMVGLDFGSNVEGIPVKCKLGKDGHMTIEVEYQKN